MLSEKGLSEQTLLKAPAEGIYSRLSEVLMQGASYGKNEPDAFKPSLFILCSTTDVMVNNGITTRGGKKGKEVTISGLTTCGVHHTNTPSLHGNLCATITLL